MQKERSSQLRPGVSLKSRSFVKQSPQNVKNKDTSFRAWLQKKSKFFAGVIHFLISSVFIAFCVFIRTLSTWKTKSLFSLSQECNKVLQEKLCPP
jgi:hypothetical protein